MKKVTIVLLFCLGVFTGSMAQTKQESIRELFHLMRDDSTSLKIMNSMVPMLTQKTSQDMDSTARTKSQESMKSIMAAVTMIIAKVKDDRLKLYDRYFTQDEINEMIVFYKSPAGRKYVSVKPEITKEIVMKVFKEYLPEMEKEKKAKPVDQENKD